MKRWNIKVLLKPAHLTKARWMKIGFATENEKGGISGTILTLPVGAPWDGSFLMLPDDRPDGDES